jgi:uncharacterized DUF497 family protein
MTDADKTKNGALYFNEDVSRVERVLGKVNGRRVWTKFHTERAQDVQTKSLRMASPQERMDYLGEKNRERRGAFYKLGVLN